MLDRVCGSLGIKKFVKNKFHKRGQKKANLWFHHTAVISLLSSTSWPHTYSDEQTCAGANYVTPWIITPALIIIITIILQMSLKTPSFFMHNYVNVCGFILEKSLIIDNLHTYYELVSIRKSVIMNQHFSQDCWHELL